MASFLCSFGVVLWELLSGKFPYHQIEPYAIAFGIVKGTLSLPVPEEVPLPMRDILV